jgi:hypothetical protein
MQEILFAVLFCVGAGLTALAEAQPTSPSLRGARLVNRESRLVVMDMPLPTSCYEPTCKISVVVAAPTDTNPNCTSYVIYGKITAVQGVSPLTIVWVVRKVGPVGDKAVYEFDQSDGIHILDDKYGQMESAGGYYGGNNQTFWRRDKNSMKTALGDISYEPLVWWINAPGGTPKLCDHPDPKIINDGP